MVKISLLTFNGAPDIVREKGMARLERIVPQKNYTITDQDPDILFFLTGGSEQNALELVSSGRFYLLIGSVHDNAYASATEVKAKLNELNIPSLLLDEEEAETREILADFFAVDQAIDRLKEKKLGLIGKISEWLISSSIPASLLKSKLGIQLIEIPWEEAGRYPEFAPSAPFLDYYSANAGAGLTETARVSALLEATIRYRNLDAITVECFPMVQQHGVTACLPLARFNHQGIPAGCEGDICAIAGMMLGQELTGTIPWMANINKVSDDTCMFSHCTISPGLVAGYAIHTHFETGKGTAVTGTFRDETVTIFRFDNKLSKAFVAAGAVTGRPTSPSACRTQIEVQLTPDKVQLLRNYPLGNHHLIIPGNHLKKLTLACRALGIELVS